MPLYQLLWKDYFIIGRGNGNLMSYGLYNEYMGFGYAEPGTLINGIRQSIDITKISEAVKSSWYSDSIQGPDANKAGAYSWVKAPRYMGYPMEVGPLARMILSSSYDFHVSVMDRIITRAFETKKDT